VCEREFACVCACACARARERERLCDYLVRKV